MNRLVINNLNDLCDLYHTKSNHFLSILSKRIIKNEINLIENKILITIYELLNNKMESYNDLIEIINKHKFNKNNKILNEIRDNLNSIETNNIELNKFIQNLLNLLEE